jgi:DNA-binding CsgD family transcriptional regulator
MLHADDVRALLRLLGELRELGACSTAWRAHLTSSLQRLCGCRAALALELVFPGDPPLVDHSRARRSVANVVDFSDSGVDAGDRRRFHEDLIPYDHGADDTFQGAVPLYGTRFTRSRQQIIDDARWYRSSIANERFRPHDVNHFIISTVPVTPHTCASLGLFRAWRDPPFGAREQLLVELINEELGREWLRGLTPSLSPRQREVLEHLARGASEKEVAAALELSTHTVHDHVKALHRAYGVRSRGELVARALASRPRVRLATVAENLRFEVDTPAAQ